MICVYMSKLRSVERKGSNYNIYLSFERIKKDRMKEYNFKSPLNKDAIDFEHFCTKVKDRLI